MKRSLLALSLAVLASPSFAYNTQLDGGFTYFDNDDDITDSEGQLDLKGTYYFEPVQSKSGPLNEAAFLGHNSNVYAKYTYNYWDSKTYNDGIDNFSSELDAHHFAGGLEYFYQQFYLNGEIGFGRFKSETKISGDTYKFDYDATTYKALVGYMPLNNLLLAVGVDGFKADDSDDETNFAVKAKYVTQIGQAGQSLNLEADGTFGDTDDITIGADYYLNNAFSVGAAYNLKDDGEDDVDFFSIRSKYFINPSFAIGGAIGFGDDIQTYNANATFRF